jgi:hypothetical protein
VPSENSEPFLSTMTEPLELDRRGALSSARTTALLGALLSARSEVGRGMWRGRAWRGRAGQAFELGVLGVANGTTANSLATGCHGPPQDGQAAKAKLLARSCLRILDQGLGPTCTRSRTNRPLEKPRAMAGLAQGWAGHSFRSQPMQRTSHGTPKPDVDAPRLVTRSYGCESLPFMR